MENPYVPTHISRSLERLMAGLEIQSQSQLETFQEVLLSSFGSEFYEEINIYEFRKEIVVISIVDRHKRAAFKVRSGLLENELRARGLNQRVVIKNA